MTPPRASSRDTEDEPDDDDEAGDEEESPPSRKSRDGSRRKSRPADDEEEEETPPRRRTRSSLSHRSKDDDREPVRRWKSGAEDEADEEEVPPRRKPIYWRARDSLYFEPLVALAIIVLVLVGLFAYTQNWPPIYVVESNSMQHGSGDQVGLINAGDLVLAQKVPTGQIKPYVVGLAQDYSTYGEYGDVILYEPNGVSGTPVIHRAILYLTWNPASDSYNASELSGLACGNASGAIYSTPGTPNDCGTTDLTGTLNLYQVGWMSVHFSLDLSAVALGEHSGFVTMGDNNFDCLAPNSCVGIPDQSGVTTPVISSLVEPGWVIGVARGMIPWFGSLKLLISGDAGKVPAQSWEYLGLFLVGIIVLAFALHYALRREGVETPLRREEEEEAAEARSHERDEDDEEEPPPRRSSLRPWRKEDEDDDLSRDDAKSAKKSTSGRRRQGRPRPSVKRRKSEESSEDDDEL